MKAVHRLYVISNKNHQAKCVVAYNDKEVTKQTVNSNKQHNNLLHSLLMTPQCMHRMVSVVIIAFLPHT